MTKEQIKKIMPIISAFAEGKIIQMKIESENVQWSDLTEKYGLPVLNLAEEPDAFRIKPEPKYRPFANVEECWTEMLKHQPFGWTYDYTNNIWDSIARVTSSGIIYEEDMMCFEDVFNRVKFADGVPFGVKVEE